MSTPIKLLTAAIAAFGFVFVAAPSAHAQSNLNHFYMARQQVQIIDNSPIVNYQQGPGPGAPGQPGAAAPNRPMPLPRAGFQQYSPVQPSGFTTGLPRVENGVPPKLPPTAQAPPANGGKKGKTGSLKYAKKKTAAKSTSAKTAAAPTTPPKLKTYSPYKGYDPNTHTAAKTNTGGAATGGTSTKTNVKGSVLHWARGKNR